MDISYLFYGYYTICLRSTDFKRFWSICAFHGLSLSELYRKETTDNDISECYCHIRCDRFMKLQEIANKTNVNITIHNRKGFPVFYETVKLHIWFFAGAVMALFLLIYLSECLWNINYEGNCYYGNEKLRRFLKENNIICGMKIDKIDCIDLSANIRNHFPRITWASCEIDGCNLIIHIKENILLEEEEKEIYGAYDLIAEKDGIIKNILVRQGIAKVEIGQSVKKGDVLISGHIPIENDAMEVIAYESVVSDGDVVISCDYAYYEQIKRKYNISKIIEEKTLPLVQIGNYQMEGVWLNKPNDLQNNYFEEWISRSNLYITHSFSLPILWGSIKQRIYTVETQNYTDSQLRELSEKHFFDFCINLEKKGVQIYENNVKMYLSDASCTRTGNVTVLEKTGKLSKALEINLDDNEVEE